MDDKKKEKKKNPLCTQSGSRATERRWIYRRPIRSLDSKFCKFHLHYERPTLLVSTHQDVIFTHSQVILNTITSRLSHPVWWFGEKRCRSENPLLRTLIKWAGSELERISCLKFANKLVGWVLWIYQRPFNILRPWLKKQMRHFNTLHTAGAKTIRPAQHQQEATSQSHQFLHHIHLPDFCFQCFT